MYLRAKAVLIFILSMHTSLLKSQDLHLDRLKFNSRLYHLAQLCPGLPGSSDGKESACNAGDLGFTPALGRFPGEGNGNPLTGLLPGETRVLVRWLLSGRPVPAQLC